MATTAPQAGTSTPVSTAAKRPAKTQNFLKSLRAALSIFDDEIATLTDVHETAYETFVMAYKAAFTKIWPKIDGADCKDLFTGFCRVWTFYQFPCFAYNFLVFSFRGVRFCLGNICERFARRDLC